MLLSNILFFPSIPHVLCEKYNLWPKKHKITLKICTWVNYSKLPQPIIYALQNMIFRFLYPFPLSLSAVLVEVK